ncbi:DUF4176 domain-containing protein [Staphylococcus lugdunensis]|uniref:DUF4176 domain-containing protein n=1 Tax=Staphylococcus lugdunensis TaxID=28035 RepID=A0A133Q5L4_STALU|nr:MULTISPECIES: DUF4176 domain-containing protein [Staphylococcus]AMG62143.1 type II secretion protein [Staphylococcus lugdunensis]AMG63934.1 DUF4176 domain-containing protein [Staphylococcus lugdunensis]ARJ08440.1 type II secretion protein [Staphylococcus lugdunensis]ARJ10666.1 type II secretion protein [Staphylococcus lugdunensis]ARJ13197.1 type II secretion protein [Staphylococcus lugdunensis]
MITIGSIVYLKGGSQKMMILNRGPIIEQDDKKVMFDYSACKYPLGLVENQIYYFNTENVDRVIFEGYSDDDEIRFQELYQEMLNELSDDITRGEVEEKQFGLE